jgi:hypothetical protein
VPRYDPEERFSLAPLSGEDVLRRLLGAEPEEGAECEPEEGETVEE